MITMIVIFVLLAIILAAMMFVVVALRRFARELDNLRFDMEEAIGKEKKERQTFDNTIMNKLHERYDTLVKWLDRISRNTNKQNKP